MPAAKKPTTRKKKEYVAVVGIDLPDGTRLEPGDPYPGKPVKWLIDQGLVKEAE